MSSYTVLLTEVKSRIRSAQYEALKTVNRELISLCWDIGKMIVKRQKGNTWGRGIVERLAKDLQMEFPGIQGFSVRNIWNMRKFYVSYYRNKKLQPLVAEISWSHNLVIMEQCKDKFEQEFYLRMSKKYGWSKNILIHQIENGTYRKTLANQTNFKKTLPEPIRGQAQLAVKDEYIFDFLELGEEHSERQFETAVLSKVERFLKELGGLFSFIGSQYRLQIEDKEYFIDLLLHHRRLKCLVAVELLCGAPHNKSSVALPVMWRNSPLALSTGTSFDSEPHNFIRIVLLIYGRADHNPKGSSTMFDQLFQRPNTLKRHLDAPLLEDRLRYLKHRAAEEIKLHKIREIACYQLIAIRYLRLKNDGRIIALKEIRRAGKCWALHEMRQYFYKEVSFSQCKSRFITHVKNWLSFLGRIEIPPRPLIPPQVNEFVDYMRKERDLSEATIRLRRFVLTQFFRQLKKEPEDFLAHATPRDMDGFLMKKFRQGAYAPTTIQLRGDVFRAFFRYAESRRWCRPGISDSIQAPRVYKHAAVPYSPSWEDVQRLLKTTEGNRPGDIRSRAIIMLLAVYGMRAGEVRNLRLDDFDWEQETFRFNRSKLGPVQQFPLVRTVGQVLLRYLKEVRPQRSKYREFFLTTRAPYRPIRTLFGIVNWRWKSLNVPIKHHGAHSLRHACATRMINQGVSLKTIADQLGHRNLETTRIYAKVDLPRLRKVADFSMGGLS